MGHMMKQLLLQVIVIITLLPLSQADLNSDKQALQAFAAAVPHGSKLLQWDDLTDMCTSWLGITCTPDGTRVVSVELRGVGLSGPLPLNTIRHLDALTVLDLGWNLMNGSLPSDFTYLYSLTSLILKHNQFTSDIPRNLPRHLHVLDLSYNFLTGGLPEKIQFLHDLNTLNLQFNHLTGVIPVLKLPNLVHIDVSHNNFSGAIPLFFETFHKSSFSANPFLCGAPLETCPTDYLDFFLDIFTLILWIFKDLFTWMVIIYVFIAAVKGYEITFIINFIEFLAHHTRFVFKFLKDLIDLQRQIRLSYNFGFRVPCTYTSDTFFNETSEKIADGSMGSTYLTKVNVRYTAVKLLEDVVLGGRAFTEKMDTIAKISDHPNITTVWWSGFSEFPKIVVYQYHRLGNLKNFLHGDGRRSWDLEIRIWIACQIATAVAYIHKKGSIHGNLKASNVFITDAYERKISVAEHGLVLLNHKIGGYLPPEIPAVGSTPQGDVFSFGVLLLELLTGLLPEQFPRTAHNGKQVCDIRSWVINNRSSSALYDPDIRDERIEFVHREHLLDTGLCCANTRELERPKMVDVVESLDRLHKIVLRIRGGNQRPLR